MVMSGVRGSHTWDSFSAYLRIQNIWDVLDKSGTDGAECSRKVASGRGVVGVIRFLVNAVLVC